jgi:F-type H+-transporting ATPase subunit b
LNEGGDSLEGGLPLGISPIALLGQLLNLVLLFFILRRFVFKRFVTVLDERSARIKKGLEDAEIAAKRAAEAEEVYQERIEQAERERRAILAKAAQEAETLKEDILAKAEDEARQIIAKEREDFEAERAQAAAELRGQMTDLVVMATRRVVEHATMDEATQRSLVDEFLAEVGELA